jgi:hypothetical protein
MWDHRTTRRRKICALTGDEISVQLGTNSLHYVVARTVACHPFGIIQDRNRWDSFLDEPATCPVNHRRRLCQHREVIFSTVKSRGMP